MEPSLVFRVFYCTRIALITGYPNFHLAGFALRILLLTWPFLAFPYILDQNPNQCEHIICRWWMRETKWREGQAIFFVSRIK